MIETISISPSVLGREHQVRNAPLYFEIYEPFFQQSVLLGDWKGYRTGTAEPLELYDLKTDPKEAHNLAAKHPDIVKQIEAIMKAEHTPSPHYTTRQHAGQGKVGKDKKQKPNTSLGELLDDQ